MNRLRRYAGMAVDVIVGLERPPHCGTGVLVLGMHRSGTSAITALVSLLGPELGDQADLMPADRENQKGYWESASLAEFQESLLHKLGGGWARPPAPRTGWEEDWRLVRRVGLARRTFRSVYGDPREWLWKDPRTVLLLPFWRRALRFEPIVVGIFRDPVEVAGSLKARDGFERERAFSLWEAYNSALLANTHGLPTFIVAYEDLLCDAPAIGRRLADFLESQGVSVRRPHEDALRSCIDVGLRHNVHSAMAGTPHEDLSDAQSELLTALYRARGAHLAFGDLRSKEAGDLDQIEV